MRSSDGSPSLRFFATVSDWVSAMRSSLPLAVNRSIGEAYVATNGRLARKQGTCRIDVASSLRLPISQYPTRFCDGDGESLPQLLKFLQVLPHGSDSMFMQLGHDAGLRLHQRRISFSCRNRHKIANSAIGPDICIEFHDSPLYGVVNDISTPYAGMAAAPLFRSVRMTSRPPSAEA